MTILQKKTNQIEFLFFLKLLSIDDCCENFSLFFCITLSNRDRDSERDKIKVSCPNMVEQINRSQQQQQQQ